MFQCLNLPQKTFVMVKTCWRRLEHFFSVTSFLSSKTSSRLLEDVFKTFEVYLKTFWRRLEDDLRRRLEDVFGRHIANTSWKHLEDVFKTPWKTNNCYAEDFLKTSWKRRNVCWDNKRQGSEYVSYNT